VCEREGGGERRIEERRGREKRTETDSFGAGLRVAIYRERERHMGLESGRPGFQSQFLCVT
jgi:hypothetical protein